MYVSYKYNLMSSFSVAHVFRDDLLGLVNLSGNSFLEKTDFLTLSCY